MKRRESDTQICCGRSRSGSSQRARGSSSTPGLRVDGNGFVRSGRHVFFDWGDSCVSHPFHTLVVTLRSVAMRFDLEPGGDEVLRLRDAYLEPFGSFAEPATLGNAFAVAYRVGTIGRTLAWHTYVREPGLKDYSELAGGVPYGLQRYLENGPIGTWRWE
jgi:hypothetical protein